MTAEQKWENLRCWLENDKRNGSSHKVIRALYLMDELDDRIDKEEAVPVIRDAVALCYNLKGALSNPVTDLNIDYCRETIDTIITYLPMLE